MLKCNNCSTTDVKYFFCENCYKNNLKIEKLNTLNIGNKDVIIEEKEKLKINSEDTVKDKKEYYQNYSDATNQNSLNNFYDIIVNIDSLKNIEIGWKIKFSENGYKIYESGKDEPKIVIGILGNKNRGKSFLISKLSNDNITDHFIIKAEGISIKFSESNFREV